LTYILLQTVYVYSFIQFFSDELRKTILFRNNRRRGRFGRSRASKVTDIGANRKRGYDFLLVRNSNVIVTLVLSCTVSEIWQVLCATYPTPIQHQFWGCSRCSRSPMLGVSQHMGLKLFGREIIFEEFQCI